MAIKPAELDPDPRVVAAAKALASIRHGWHPDPKPADLRDAHVIVAALKVYLKE